MTDWIFRPFGQQICDLDVDFRGVSQPHVVTAVLCCCATSAGSPDEAWQFSVGRRTALLLQIGRLSGVDQLHIVQTCANGNCQEQLEVDLSVAALAAAQDEATEPECLPIALEGQELILRRPTGADQIAWQQRTFADRHEAVGAMVRSLVVEPAAYQYEGDALSEDDVDTIGAALHAADPLVGLTVEVDCPGCGEPASCLVDVQQAMLMRLEHRQRHLFREVHDLAQHYHWREEDILKMSRFRRQRYLDLIDREGPA